MMKKAMAILLQFFLLLLVFAVGSFLAPFHIETVLAPMDGRTRAFLWDGVLLMLLAYVLILLLELARKRLGRSLGGVSLALILAGLSGWLLKFGFVSRGW